MSGREGERRRRFKTLFASYIEDVVAYCRWRAAPGEHLQQRLLYPLQLLQSVGGPAAAARIGCLVLAVLAFLVCRHAPRHHRSPPGRA